MVIKNVSIEDLFLQAVDFEKKGNLLKAQSIYKEIIKINSQLPKVYYNLGNILKDLGKYEQAINCYERVIEIDPQNISAINNLGVSYREIKEYQKAISYFNQTIEINPNLVISYLNLVPSEFGSL